jgi:uncharacterized protein with HEPN domain
MRDERLLFKDTLTALDRIDSYTGGMSFEAFIADEKTANAVINKVIFLIPNEGTATKEQRNQNF